MDDLHQTSKVHQLEISQCNFLHHIQLYAYRLSIQFITDQSILWFALTVIKIKKKNLVILKYSKNVKILPMCEDIDTMYHFLQNEE